MPRHKDDRKEPGGERQRDGSRAEHPLIDSNKPTPGQAEGERDVRQQSEPNRDEGDRSDREDNL